MAAESNLNSNARICLASIVHYYLLVRSRDRKQDKLRATLAKDIGLHSVYENNERNAERLKKAGDTAERAEFISSGARKILDNFVSTASTLGADEILAHFRRLHQGRDRYLTEAPVYINTAIDLLFHKNTTEVVSERVVHSKANQEVYDTSQVVALIRQSDDSFLQKISDAYHGLWWVIRYSAHAAPGEIPKKLKQGGFDAWTVLAAMEIGKRNPEIGLNDPTFRIHYRPWRADNKNHFSVTGSMLSIRGGPHLFFLGCEHDSDYPLCIIAPRHGEAVSSFPGIVLRRHERTPIFSTRVMFVRASNDASLLKLEKGPASSEFTALDALTNDIGVYLESELKKQLASKIGHIDEILAQVRNSIDFDGKSGLTLLEAQTPMDNAEASWDHNRADRSATAAPAKGGRRQRRSRRRR